MSPGSLAKLAPFISTLRAKWNLIGLSLFEGAWFKSVLCLNVETGCVVKRCPVTKGWGRKPKDLQLQSSTGKQ